MSLPKPHTGPTSPWASRLRGVLPWVLAYAVLAVLWVAYAGRGWDALAGRFPALSAWPWLKDAGFAALSALLLLVPLLRPYRSPFGQPRRRGEREALTQQEAQFRQLHDSLSDVLWLSSPDGRRLLYLSPSYETIYGRSVASLVAAPRSWLETVVEDDRERVYTETRALRTRGSVAIEYRIRRPDGSVRWVLDRKKRIVDDRGRTVMLGGILQDVTAAREARESLQRLNESLETRVRQRTNALVQANTELEAFARTAAHDLKTPLNGIIGYTQLMTLRAQQAGDAQALAMLSRVDRSAAAMARLIDDLLALSRVSLAEVQRSVVDLGAVAREVLDELRVAEPARRVDMTVADGLEVRADPGLARALLGNLIGNAWKYTGQREDAAIEVGRAEDAHGVPVFFVRDNGTGFPVERADKLFEPFQRLHEAHEFAGTGIGLATCQRITTRHGGRIWATSEVGVGSTFYFTLAAADDLTGRPTPPTQDLAIV